MDNLYENYDDQYIIATKIYVKTDDAYAYADSNKTLKIGSEDLKDLFERGIVVIDGDNEYKPISFTIADSVGTLTYVETDGTTPTTAVLAVLKSKEYVVGG